ncbi:MAG: hypothetical protein JXA68_10380 [Ignavibacteriales bacterium]|nr:hypothetical protein [Ignavibacteriales bacterium]
MVQYKEQEKIFEDLRLVERTIKGKDFEEYKMFKKRHFDDEDLDRISLSRLKELYDKYYVNRKKMNYKNPFEN